MIARALLATIFVGLFTGLFMSVVQQWRVVPLIIAAEKFEGEAGHEHSAIDSNLALVSPAHADEVKVDSADTGFSRFGGTILSNLVTYSGFALVLFGMSALLGKPVSPANALVWAACCWLSFHFLPAIGLPPELPGFPAGDLQARQIWWVATVVLSGAGLAILAFKAGPMFQTFGVILIVIPHVFGAPQPSDITSALPAFYAAEYAVAALAASLISWLVLAFGLALANDRLNKLEV